MHGILVTLVVLSFVVTVAGCLCRQGVISRGRRVLRGRRGVHCFAVGVRRGRALVGHGGVQVRRLAVRVRKDLRVGRR